MDGGMVILGMTGGKLPLVFTTLHLLSNLERQVHRRALRRPRIVYRQGTSSLRFRVSCAAPDSWQGKVGFEEVIGQGGADGETAVVHAVTTTSRPSEVDEESSQTTLAVKDVLEETNLSDVAVAKFNIPSPPVAVWRNRIQSHSYGL